MGLKTPCAPAHLPRAPQLIYSTFMGGLASANIQLNRRVLADLAMSEPFSFKALVDQVKQMRGLAPAPAPAKEQAAAGAGRQP